MVIVAPWKKFHFRQVPSPPAQGKEQVDYPAVIEKAKAFHESHLSSGNPDLMRAHKEQIELLPPLMTRWEKDHRLMEKNLHSNRYSLKRVFLLLGGAYSLIALGVIFAHPLALGLGMLMAIGGTSPGIKACKRELFEVKRVKRAYTTDMESLEKQMAPLCKKLTMVEDAIGQEIFSRQMGLSRKQEKKEKALAIGEKKVRVGDVEVPVSNNT